MDRTCFHCLLDKWKMEVGRERGIEQVGDEEEKGDRETEKGLWLSALWVLSPYGSQHCGHLMH